MQDIQLLKQHINAGDIVVLRRRDTVSTFRMNGETYSFWEKAYLYLGNDQFLNNKNIISLEQDIPPIVEMGLFRLKNQLTNQEFKTLYKKAIASTRFKKIKHFFRRIFFIKEKEYSNNSEIVRLFSMINRSFVDHVKETDVTASDFDRSETTIRIL